MATFCFDSPRIRLRSSARAVPATAATQARLDRPQEASPLLAPCAHLAVVDAFAADIASAEVAASSFDADALSAAGNAVAAVAASAAVADGIAVAQTVVADVRIAVAVAETPA